MGLLLFEIGVLSLSLNYSILRRQPFAISINMINIIHILLIYIFGLLTNRIDIFSRIFPVLYSLSIVLSFYFIYLNIKRDDFDFKNIFSPSLLFYIIMISITFYANYGSFFREWDEFSHWGLAARNMFQTMNFGRGLSSNVVAIGYPPGANIFQLIPLFNSSTFIEFYVIQAHVSLIIGFLTLAFLNLNLKEIQKWLFIFASIIYITLQMDISIFNQIYADALLAVTFFGLIITQLDYIRSKRFYLIIILISFFLPLIKSTGFHYSLVANLVFFFVLLLEKRSRFSIKYLLITILPLLVSIASNFSWTSFINRAFDYSGSQIAPSMFTFRNILSLIDWNLLPNIYQKTTISNFLYTILFEPIQIFFPVSYLTWIILFLSVYVVLLLKNKKSLLLYLVLILIGFFAYLLSLLIFYVYGFGEYESINLASIHRYIMSYILPLFLITIHIMVSYITINPKYGKFILQFLIISTLVFMSFNIQYKRLFSREFTYNSIKLRSNYQEFENFIDKYVNDENRIYFIAENSNGLEYWIARYLATPSVFAGNGSWSIGDFYDETDIWTNPHTEKTFEEALLAGNYDFVYLYEIDAYFVMEFQSLFIDPNSIIKQKGYEVFRYTDNSGDHVALKLLD